MKTITISQHQDTAHSKLMFSHSLTTDAVEYATMKEF